MKALTLTQPWATLIALEAKRIETRSWSTAYRGPLAIHAAAGLGPVGGKRGLDEVCCDDPFWFALRPLLEVLPGTRRYAPDVLPLGAIVAICELTAVARIDHYEPWPDEYDAQQRGPFLNFGSTGQPLPDEPERSFGDYSVGRYAWILTNIRALPEPIPANGALGLWHYDGELP